MGGTVVVLTYHRVVDGVFDPERLAISTDRFAEHVAAFSARYELMSVGTMLTMLSEGEKLPSRGLAITFDDGYADALAGAYPILRACNAPTTVFVTTSGLAQAREFWWDDLERLLFCAALPGVVRVPGPDLAPVTVDIPAEDRPAPSAGARERHVRFDVTQPASDLRERLYLELSQRLRPLAPEKRDALLGAVREQIGQAATTRPDHRSLTPAELRELSRDGLVEIGAHTVNHPWLASLSLGEQREEIVRSKRDLEDIIGAPVISFSYPYGTAGSFTRHTETLVRDAGFLGAVTTELGKPLPWGSVSLDGDRFALPRMPGCDVPAADIVAAIDRRLGL
jgi:peptidoglycan/xylan/chitin deacetylase (PgdA/CDA1 family)